MGKRATALGAHTKSNKSHKTKKRLAIKKETLAATAAKRRTKKK